MAINEREEYTMTRFLQFKYFFESLLAFFPDVNEIYTLLPEAAQITVIGEAVKAANSKAMFLALKSYEFTGLQSLLQDQINRVPNCGLSAKTILDTIAPEDIEKVRLLAMKLCVVALSPP